MADKKCRYCGRLFVPDARVGDRQAACSVACQKLRKHENNRRYRKKNPGYTLLEVVQSHAENVPDEAEEHIGEFVDALAREGLAGPDSDECGFFPADSAPPQRKNLPAILRATQVRQDRSGVSAPS